MKKTILALAAMGILLSACNTFEGMGKDLQGAGEGISSSASATKEKMKEQP